MHQPSQDQATKILGELPVEQAFYFYSGVGFQTGKSARSLVEFIDSIKVIEPTSLEFHAQRGDFENWIKMLGDETLSQQIVNVRKFNLQGEALRKRLLQVLRLRYGFLNKISKTSTG